MQYLVVKELEVLCINERTCQKLDISYGKFFFNLKNVINLRYWISDFYKLWIIVIKKIKQIRLEIFACFMYIKYMAVSYVKLYYVVWS